jgi:restriction system protein
MTVQPTITSAVLAVMNQAGAPVSAKEAYLRIVEQKLYEFHTPDPEHVVTTQIRRHCKDLDFPSASNRKYFGMVGGKYFPLPDLLIIKSKPPNSKTLLRGGAPTLAGTLKRLKQLHAEHRELLKDRLLADLKKLTPAAFEKFSRRILEVYGFDGMKVTKVTSDGGIDGFGRLKVGIAHMRVAFQCKRWLRLNVGRREIDMFRGAIQGAFEQGIFFTTAEFAAGAKAVSIRPGAVPIVLIDGPAIAELMIEKNFGVEQEALPVYTYALDLIISDDEQSQP